MKVLISGGTGRLGRELVKFFPDCLHPTRAELDITDVRKVSKYIWRNRPDVVIHTAALTDVTLCEKDRQLAYKINVTGTIELLNFCLSTNPNCYFVLVSTACVFFGDRGYYTETDIPCPKNFYGTTKMSAEAAVSSLSHKYLIIRTNFVAREKWRYSKAFTDRYGTYLFADDVAHAIKDVVSQNLTGIVHICGDRKMSMFELAKLTTPDVEPMTLAEYKGVPLTVDMTLRSTRIKPYKIGYAKDGC
jgi:dTDP-4-dehydrorhamnose reductase